MGIKDLGIKCKLKRLNVINWALVIILSLLLVIGLKLKLVTFFVDQWVRDVLDVELKKLQLILGILVQHLLNQFNLFVMFVMIFFFFYFIFSFTLCLNSYFFIYFSSFSCRYWFRFFLVYVYYVVFTFS